MNRIEFKDKDGNTWVRISKKEAKNRYEKGEELIFIPCKARPFTEWHLECLISPEKERPFESVVNEFSFYNCQTNELGKYPSYYKKESEEE